MKIEIKCSNGILEIEDYEKDAVWVTFTDKRTKQKIALGCSFRKEFKRLGKSL